MTTHTLRISGPTLETIMGIAKETGVDSDRPVAQVTLEALRLYQWLLNHQAAGRTIVALEQRDIDVLTETDAVDGEREVLVNLRIRKEQQP
jgi:hypothetical protein